MLNPKNFLYYVSKGTDPKKAFEVMKEEILMWNEFDNKDTPTFFPKRFTIYSDPANPLSDEQVQNYITTNNFFLRNNYAGCIFLTNERFLFYMHKEKANE